MPNSLLDRVSLGVHAAAAGPYDVIAIAQRIERVGLHGVTVGDSALDSFSVLSAVAAATTRIQVRTGVALLGRTPVQTVFAAATVDQLARGRFRLGIGVGSREKTAGWHNLDYSRPVGRLRDFVAAVRAAWATTPGAPQSFASDHYQFRNFAVIRPNFTERLPIDLGVNGPQMLRLGGAVADGVMFNDLHTGAYLRDVALPEVARGEESAGRPIGSARRIGAFSVSLATTREAAIARARAGVQAYLSISHNRNVLAHYGFDHVRVAIEAALATGDPANVARAIPDDVVTTFAVCGTPEDCKRAIVAYADVLDEVIVHIPEWRTPGPAAIAAYEELTDAFAPR